MIRKSSFTFVSALLCTVVLAVCLPARAAQWKALILPASLNQDSTISLIGSEVQVLTLALQADKDITSRGDIHRIELEWDLPPGMNIIEANGVYQFSPPQSQEQNGRTITWFDVQVANKNIIGVPGSTINSDWQNQAVFVNTPQSVPSAQAYIGLKLQDGETIQNFRWPLKIQLLAPPALRPKSTVLGLWDYNYARAAGIEATSGIARFLKDCGVSFTQLAGGETYRKALQAQGILTGGNTHQDFFFSRAYPDYSAKGTAATGGFADPQSILALPPDAVIPGVKQIIANAQAGDGIATLDYEPGGTGGFNPVSTAKFKAQYNISDENFAKFQQYVAQNGLKTFQSTDPAISAMWRQWTEFRSEQTSNYVRRIYESVKKQAPNVRLAITPSRTFGRDSLRTLALGCDDAAMAQYTDIIMPQIYSGYGAANAKLAMQMTAGWRQEIQQQKAKTQLWPLLLVRYSGAGVSNSPQRLLQQIIGGLAHGANGILLYYPSNMDAPYWEMIARTNETVARYEDFYQDGKRVDSQFPVSGLPEGSVQVDMYPNYQETVQNPDWSFTAHQLGGKVLLTLMNLEEANDLVFDVNTGGAKVLSAQDARKQGEHQWLVAPGQIGFVVLERG